MVAALLCRSTPQSSIKRRTFHLDARVSEDSRRGTQI